MIEVDSTQTLSPDTVGDAIFLSIVGEQQGVGLEFKGRETFSCQGPFKYL